LYIKLIINIAINRKNIEIIKIKIKNGKSGFNFSSPPEISQKRIDDKTISAIDAIAIVFIK
jgi:hypothetical protein